MRVLRPTQRSTDLIVADVAASVRAGGTLIFPTETVYGIGCDPDDAAAIDAVFAAKGRSANKPLALHVTDVTQAEPFVTHLGDLAHAAIRAFWPGPVAIVVKRNPERFQRAACAFETISLRCPDDELCQAILKGAGPLAATSANRAGAPPFLGDVEDLQSLPRADLAVLAGPTKLRMESTIVDCTHETPVVLREGAVLASAVAAALGTLRSTG